MHYLYRVTNQVNKKVYIGQSIKPEYRWYQHKSHSAEGSDHKQYFHRAMAKYGIENFIFEIIAVCKTQDDANETESFLIVQYNSRNQEFGYNLMVGGSYGGHSEETKRKQSEATIKQIETKGHPAAGRIVSESEKELHRKERLDNPLDYTSELRKKMSEAHIGLKDSEETKVKKSLKITEAWNKRQALMIESGEFKCNAHNCNVSGVNIHYLIINDIRYCVNHGQRLKRNGTLDPLPRYVRRILTDEERKKYGAANIGRVAHNRIVFSEEQTKLILTDSRSNKKIAKDFGVTEKVIKRIKLQANS